MTSASRGRRIAVAADQGVPRGFGLGRRSRHEGDAVAGGHVGAVSAGAAARRPRGSEADMDRAVFVYTTYPSVVEAEKAGKALVENGLAACVNILPGMVSHYRWQGAVERGEEAVMLIKTRASLAEAGARGGQRVAPLRHAGHSRDADRERGRNLFRLDHGLYQALGRGLTRRDERPATRSFAFFHLHEPRTLRPFRRGSARCRHGGAKIGHEPVEQFHRRSQEANPLSER